MAPSDILPMSHAEYNDQLFRSALFSDCTVTSNGRSWSLHRAILSPRCEFFWTCFDSDFEEGISAEVDMPDDDPDTLDRMLRWIYTLQWPSNTAAPAEPWTSDLLLYRMADKYGLGSLVDESRNALLRQAVLSSDPSQKQSCDRFLTYLEDFVDMFTWLFAEGGERDEVVQLRGQMIQIMAPMVARHMREQHELECLMRSVPGFAVELVEKLAAFKTVQMRSSPHGFSSVLGMNTIRPDSLSGSDASGRSPTHKPYIPLNEDSEDESV